MYDDGTPGRHLQALLTPLRPSRPSDHSLHTTHEYTTSVTDREAQPTENRASVRVDTDVRYPRRSTNVRPVEHEPLSAAVRQQVACRYRQKRTAVSEATAVFFQKDATVFGRLLVALGAPAGNRGPNEEIVLPPYLTGAPEETRLAFARTVVWHRGAESTAANYPVQVCEQRSERYWSQLRWLFESLVGDGVRGDEPCVRFEEDAVEKLYRPPAV